MSPVNLSNRRFVDSFHNFIFADEAARAPCVYGLKLPNVRRVGTEECTDSQPSTMQQRLVAILQAAVHLEYLHLPSVVDLDLVLTAAANMTSLRELHLVFGQSSRPPWQILGTFCSPLQSLRVEREKDDSWIDYDFWRMTLLHDHLAAFAPTLEVLELQMVYFDISPSLITTPFTALRSFTTHWFAGFNESTMVALLQLFPNLDDTLFLDFLDTMEMEFAYRSIRECSMEAQRARAWSCLDRVACNVDLAFVMALRCPIRRMDLRMYYFSPGRASVSSILRHSCPQILHFRLPLSDFDLDDLDDLFPSEGVDLLTHLVMFAPSTHLDDYGRYKLTSWNQFRDKLISSMKHLRLTHLRIVFYYSLFMPDGDFIGREPAKVAGDTDLYAAATAFFSAIPTLRHLSSRQIQSGERNTDKWLSSKAWRIAEHRVHEGDQLSNAKSRSTKSIVALSTEAANRIVEQEELDLCSSDKSMVQVCGDASTWGD
ncbi:hypothetical protein GSI_05820 [Ganoderma sinense ZZ0214-1]|uniref:F-box domain-containing protein n=1 Tax=Ganoderma sinense ZZ0214-1 TaxID=1077348 RepID=A0A2G8SBI2_9APHY|nr:hypothetical protein GSI_05820 [Ganoderma sinense ZZ0214-1]